MKPMKVRTASIMTALGSAILLANPALAEIDYDGTFIVGPSGPIINVAACRYDKDTLEWEVDLGNGNGFQPLENAICDGKNITETGVKGPGGTDIRKQRATDAKANRSARERFRAKPVRKGEKEATDKSQEWPD